VVCIQGESVEGGYGVVISKGKDHLGTLPLTKVTLLDE